MRIEDLNIDSVLICTPAKVASASFLYSIQPGFSGKVHHRHCLHSLKNALQGENNLIITGIRNPLDRNISYFFQHYHLDHNSDFRTSANNYEGEYCYVMPREELLETDTLELINLFFSHQNHFSFNDWFYEFFEITKIVDTAFDKNVGIQIYSLPNNNYLMVYVYEKILTNLNFIQSFFNIKEFRHDNNSSILKHKTKYKTFKDLITLDEVYKTKLLNTPIMKYFYSDEAIEEFYRKYK